MKKLLACLLVALGSQTVVCAQTPFSATYDFTIGNNVVSFPFNGAPVANLAIGPMVKSAGITTTAGSPLDSFRATQWTTGGSVDTNEYIGFTVTADPGFALVLSNLNFGVNRSTNGPKAFVWHASTNGFTSSVALTSYTAVNTNFSQSGGVLALTNFSATNSVNYLGMVLDASALGSVTNAEFRLYAYDAVAGSDAGGLGGAFTFTGLVNEVLTSQLVWYGDGVTAGGSGTWSAAETNWFNPETTNMQTWDPARTARFGATGGTVTVDAGGVAAGPLTEFAVTGYTMTGGPLSFSNGTNTVNVFGGATAVMESGLAGADVQLRKTGAGTLVLAASNTFSGRLEPAAGTVLLASEAALGVSTNPLVLAGGAVAVTNDLSLGADRAVRGNGTFDVAGGKVLSILGPVSNSATTLRGTGTLDLQGAQRALGALVFAAPGALSAAGPVSLTSLNTSGLLSGSIALQANLEFPTGDQTLAVNNGVFVEVNGSLSGLGTGRILKTGAGTLVLNGSNSLGGIRVGAAGPTPVPGGVLVINNAAATGAGQVQLQDGTLRTDVSGGLALPNGLSIAGRDGALAVLGGTEPLAFGGTNDFFRSSGTSGPLRFDVQTTAIFSGPWTGTSGDGTADGITIGDSYASGLLVLNGNASALTEDVTLTESLTLQLNTTLGGNLIVGGEAVLTGSGTVNGDLTVDGIIAPGGSNSSGTLTSLGTLSVPGGVVVLRLFASGINDQVSAAGGLDLANVLQVLAEPGYVPQIGDTFALVGFGSITTQPSLDLPDLGDPNLVWNTDQFAANGIIAVADANPLPPNYANWLTNFPSIVPPDDEGTADPDGDGYDNFTEFAFDGNPTVPGFLGMKGRRDGTNSVFNWVQRKNPPGGVTYVVKRTSDLASGPWVNAADLVITNATDQSGVLLPAEYERKEFRVGPTNLPLFYYVEATVAAP